MDYRTYLIKLITKRTNYNKLYLYTLSSSKLLRIQEQL